MKKKWWKRFMIVIAIYNLLTGGDSVPVFAAETDNGNRFVSQVEQALEDGAVECVVWSQPFSEKKSIYALLERTCRKLDAPKAFIENQCYVTYRMVTAGSNYYLCVDIKEYEKNNDLDPSTIVKQLDLEGKSDLDKAVIVHEWLSNALSYGPSASSLQKCLDSGVGKCDDYSMIYATVMNAAGVETRCMDGVPYGETSGHMWNMVYIEHEWYFCDVTNDDLENTYRYFLKAIDSDEVRSYLGDYIDGFRLCNGVDEFLSYDLAEEDYFCYQIDTGNATVNLADELDISKKVAKKAQMVIVQCADSNITRVKKAAHKISVGEDGVGVVYGIISKSGELYNYIINCN